MTEVDPRLVAALREQLRATHGVRVGWKLGIGDRERIGDEIAVGHLTTATVLEAGSTYTPADGELLHADAEIALELGAGGEIFGYAAALELVDLRSPPEAPEAVVAENVFHRGVAFGPFRADLTGEAARLVVNGQVRKSGRSTADLEERVRQIARVLDAVEERLEPGDRIITGSIVQVPVAPGDQVEADLGDLGSVRLQVLARS